MTNAEAFTAAHALTRETIQDGDDYCITFGACLKAVRAWHARGIAHDAYNAAVRETYDVEREHGYGSEEHVAADFRKRVCRAKWLGYPVPTAESDARAVAAAKERARRDPIVGMLGCGYDDGAAA